MTAGEEVGRAYDTYVRKAALSMSDVKATRTAVLVDPHPLWLDAVTQVVEQAGFTVVATSTTFAEGRALVEQHSPDLLVAEIYGDDGVDGTSWLVEVGALSASLKAIVLSLCAEEDRIESAFRAGALAYVLKTA